MTARLLEAGYVVRGFDVSADARAAFGEGAVEDVAAVADGADAVVLMLPNSAIVSAVARDGGLLDALAPGTLLLDMGSSEPLETQALEKDALSRDVQLVDAPVSGGVRGAKAGSLTIVVGGPEAHVEAARPMLEVLGGKVVRVGDIGAGHALKSLNNLLSAATLLATSEAVAAGRAFGLDPKVMVDAFNTSSGRSYSTEHKFPDFVLPGTWNAGFGLRLMLKDIRIALGLAEATGSPHELSERIVALWGDASEALPEDADHTEIARWVDAGIGGSGG
jgi:3-hydroxyisobutyrate dehydrogenase